jgi:hypothetical protein
MATVDDVYDIAVGFLAAAVEGLEHTAEGPPERSFVSYAEPALDCCGQLTVYTSEIREVDVRTRTQFGALSAQDQINRGGAITVTLVVQITRCVSEPRLVGGKPAFPPPDVQQAEAAIIDADGWAVWLGITNSLKHGELKNLCSGAVRLGGTKMPAQGGCAGWIFTYRYPIEGGILGT